MKGVLKQLACTSAAFLLALAPAAARGQTFNRPIDDGVNTAAITKDVTVTEHTGARLPLDLSFVDESGKPVTLGQYFQGKRPVVLQLGYYDCPMLCSYISQGLATSVKSISFTAGKDYEMVFVSIDPKETPELAAQKKAAFLKDYGRDAADGWHFLTGKQEQIQALAKADGFNYKWVESAGQYAHPAALTLCMPDGRISRYLYGVRFDPTTLRESLVEASNGQIGNPLDQVFLTCFRYDGHQGKYAWAAVGLMRIGGVLIMIIVGAVLTRMFLKERKQQREREAQKAGAER
ncbi:MAG TPA: SCO family protein [Tepidisphaeraceae bacterium]|jgi:protein SCO1/2